MAINSEISIASKNGSPAQICADDSGLAAIIFGSNSAVLEFANSFEYFNRTHAHTHAHTHSHASVSKNPAPVFL